MNTRSEDIPVMLRQMDVPEVFDNSLSSDFPSFLSYVQLITIIFTQGTFALNALSL